MRLIVGPERHWASASQLAPTADVLLLRSPGADPATLEAQGSLTVCFNDIAEPRAGLVAPDATAVGQILAFGRARPEVAVLCFAGVSRSTAAAYALACQATEAGREMGLAQALRRLSPAATPNPLVVSLADDALGRQGRMVAAIEAIGRGAEAFEGPVFVWELTPPAAGN